MVDQQNVTATVANLSDANGQYMVATVKVNGQPTANERIDLATALSKVRPLTIVLRYDRQRNPKTDEVTQRLVGVEGPSEDDIARWMNSAKVAVRNPLFVLGHLVPAVKEAIKTAGHYPVKGTDGRTVAPGKVAYGANYLSLWRTVALDQSNNPIMEGRAYEGIVSAGMKFGADGKLKADKAGSNPAFANLQVTIVAPSKNNHDGAYRVNFSRGDDAQFIMDSIGITPTVQRLCNRVSSELRSFIHMYGTAPTTLPSEPVKPRDTNAAAENAAMKQDVQTQPIAPPVQPATTATADDRVAVLEQKFDSLMAMLAQKLG